MIKHRVGVRQILSTIYPFSHSQQFLCILPINHELHSWSVWLSQIQSHPHVFQELKLLLNSSLCGLFDSAFFVNSSGRPGSSAASEALGLLLHRICLASVQTLSCDHQKVRGWDFIVSSRNYCHSQQLRWKPQTLSSMNYHSKGIFIFCLHKIR